jgi:methyl-accepting chemotaxis protein
MDPFLVELSRQGIGFLLMAIVTIAYLRKDKSLTEAYQKRVDDNNRLAVVIEATNTASRALEQSSAQRSRIIETIGETTQAMAEAIRGLSISLEQGKQIADSNRQQLAQLREQLVAMQRSMDKLSEECRGSGQRAFK